MTTAIRRRIEKAEACLSRPAPVLVRSILIGQPPPDATPDEWAAYERARAEATENGCKVIVLVPLRPLTRAPITEGFKP
jgi:hypothetical protein